MPVAGQLVSMTVVNMPQFLKAVIETPNQQLRYMRGELSRGIKRIRKNFIRTQLHGPPGINAPILSKGKNVRAYVRGASLKDLTGYVGISRILHVHEVGLTIQAKHGGFLYLHEKGSGRVKNRPIFAVAKSVTVPARLRFRQEVAAEGPAVLRKVAEAGTRATQDTLRKGLRQ